MFQEHLQRTPGIEIKHAWFIRTTECSVSWHAAVGNQSAECE